MILRWLLSSTVRQAADLAHRVKKMLAAQRDILTPQACDHIEKARLDLLEAIRSGAGKPVLLARAASLEDVANKWFKPYPNANLRENVDVILVALVVALGIRTFFLQPMAIPTGSMQPTLYGIMPSTPTYEPDLVVPSFPVRIFDSLFRGVDYFHVVARADGVFRLIDQKPQLVFPFVKRQRFAVGSERYTLWFPPEGMFRGFGSYGRVPVSDGDRFKRGEDIVRLKVSSGDRLFVDRVTYNFRHPRRGEIVIFQTQGIPDLEQDTHYIKRLVGLGGETLRVGNDRHVYVRQADGRFERLDASTKLFENVYSFDPAEPPRENHYSGHVNNEVGLRHRNGVALAPKFRNGDDSFNARENHYLVFGDNTMNSRDSRAWGDFPREKIVGKCAFVFWPVTGRFGWAVR